jgi:hypothetical protein
VPFPKHLSKKLKKGEFLLKLCLGKEQESMYVGQAGRKWRPGPTDLLTY